jgi:hypothetical protein
MGDHDSYSDMFKVRASRILSFEDLSQTLRKILHFVQDRLLNSLKPQIRLSHAVVLQKFRPGARRHDVTVLQHVGAARES